MTVNIREACYNDYNMIATLKAQLHTLHVEQRPDLYIQMEEPLSFDMFQSWLNHTRSTVLVCEETYRQKVIGYALLQRDNPTSFESIKAQRTVYIQEFILDEAYRGQHVGEQLFQSICNYAQKWRAERLELSVQEFNHQAIQFYEAMGMKTKSRKMEMRISEDDI
ncbi:GNAT family N-acetyltransferase [Texcoconibacillus texcoconensis]|uniref:Ribosomal protein S18 acetylase RimI-like enzyme n=1 Tax=Texcoconibacillus texcoconensis TaxID=1095777 RepID=A0A840QT31_9BACI|nr:GNAT family N-acetyltransferase [Texcoconibacillus texcoconensis]MBB5174696.1 ribosomal protein S18 acetylase RimI-like enzyme [Texcoconibacillus texcoconensis]